MNYYQQTSLGASFPGVDTTLKYPYKDMVEGGGASGGGGVSTGSLLLERPKGRSMSQPPPPSLATPLPPATSSNPQPEGWAEVLFRFIAEFQDELSIEVCVCVCVYNNVLQLGKMGRVVSAQVQVGEILSIFILNFRL